MLNWFDCIGKTRNVNGEIRTYGLINHSLDVAACVYVFVNHVLCEPIIKRIAKALGISVEYTKQIIVYLSSVHDIGKITPGFLQKIDSKFLEKFRQNNYPFPKSSEKYHGPTGLFLLEILYDDSSNVTRELLNAAACHHSFFFKRSDISKPKIRSLKYAKNKAWVKLAGKFLQAVESFLPRPEFNKIQPENLSVATVLIAGIISFCDWVGSNADSFPYEDVPHDLDDYFKRRIQDAQVAFDKIRFFERIQHYECPKNFNSVFKGMRPRKLQKIISELKEEDVRRTGLYIFEGATGCGKTKGMLFLHAMKADYNDIGLIVGMPTTGTSNQMFVDVQSYIADSNSKGVVQLAHSRAMLIEINDRFKHLQESYYASRKRGLIAPYCVSTVDQLMMGVLNINHFFVRVMGMSNKLIAIDEIHSYDTFMLDAIKRLLNWLGTIGVNVVLMSATLPSGIKRELITAYRGEEYTGEVSQHYPLVTVANDKKVSQFRSYERDTENEKKININFIRWDSGRDVPNLWAIVGETGNYVVRLNLVADTQAFYEFHKRTAPPGAQVFIFHAKYTFGKKHDTEKRVRDLFGHESMKNGGRPKLSLTFVTQIAEQSLDVDFDPIAFTALCPIDSLLQILGRILRFHQLRKEGYGVEGDINLFVFIPLHFTHFEWNNTGRIYDKWVLLRTWALLHNKGEISLPDDFRFLVEGVYNEQYRHGERMFGADYMADALTERRRVYQEEEALSGLMTIGVPDKSARFYQGSITDRFDEDFVMPRTRIGEGVSGVLRYRINGRFYFDEDGRKPWDENDKYMRNENSLSIQNAELSMNILMDESSRLSTGVHTIDFTKENGEWICRIQGSQLYICYDNELGMTFRKD